MDIIIFQIINIVLAIGLIYAIVKIVKNSSATAQSLQNIEKELKEIHNKMHKN